MHTKLFTATLIVGFAAGIGAAAAASQSVNLSQQQKQTIEQQLSGETAQAMPASFTPSPGAKVPQSVTLKPLPQQVGSQIKAVKGDDYAKLKNNDILITNPTNRQVVAVLHESRATTGSSTSMREPPSGSHSANMNVPNSPK